MRDSLYLFDASIYIFRAWFGMPDTIRDAEGREINAVYGFLLSVARFLKSAEPRYLAFAFDESLGSSFREKIYPAYKSSRALPDAALAYQLLLCRKFSQALDLACFSSKRFEADDLIGSLAHRFQHHFTQRVFVSSDKDLGQLLGKQDLLWDVTNQSRSAACDYHGFQQRFAVLPEQFADYLGLVGDAVDDIPGVPGIGSKSASALLGHFHSLDEIFENMNGGGELGIRGAQRVQQLLKEHREMAYLSRRLARIKTDVPMLQKQANSSVDALRWNGVDMKKLKAALARHQIEGRLAKSVLNAFSELAR